MEPFAAGMAECHRIIDRRSRSFAVEYSFLRSLETVGVSPTAIVAHGTAELAAACWAGFLDIDSVASLLQEDTRVGSGSPGLSLQKPLTLISAVTGEVLDPTTRWTWPEEWRGELNLGRAMAALAVSADIVVDTTVTLSYEDDSWTGLLHLLGHLWESGVDVDWSVLGTGGEIIDLPPHRFDRAPFWPTKAALVRPPLRRRSVCTPLNQVQHHPAIEPTAQEHHA